MSFVCLATHTSLIICAGPPIIKMSESVYLQVAGSQQLKLPQVCLVLHNKTKVSFWSVGSTSTVPSVP